MDRLDQILRTVNQIFEAGIAITALSLFIRSLSFNLRDRVSRSFAVVLACIMIIFSGEAISGAIAGEKMVHFWLAFQWVGILFLPAGLQHFSDALLATTGRPSRGRRRTVVILSYVISLVLLIFLVMGKLLGPVTYEGEQYPHPPLTPLSAVFGFYYLFSVVFSSIGIWRAYRRTKLRVSRRRITYLLVGVIFLAIGAYPYLQFGTAIAQRFSLIFITLVIFGNMGIFLCLMLMAYAVAFFGVPWPDRIVRSRLLKWVFRGPITVFFMLFLITLTNQLTEYLGTSYTVAIPIVSVVSVMLAEHLITLIFPYIDRVVLQNGDDDHYQFLQSLSERLISTADLKQFLEAVLAGVCDQFQVSSGFVAAIMENGWEIAVHFGSIDELNFNGIGKTLLEDGITDGGVRVFAWGDFWLYPLFSEDKNLIGLFGVLRREDHVLDDGLVETLDVLGARAAMALEDRLLQRQVLSSLEELGPKVELMQRLRAAFRFDQNEVLRDLSEFEPPKDFSVWVKDAFSHYWGGPKLTESPLMNLRVVQDTVADHDGVPANALRAILKTALEQIKPDGDQKFTPEWTMYNILEMKFVEGRKVRDVAKRLAVSEADLYRKQRIAIEAVAETILEMEMRARDS
ncbi:hypothetical protein KQH54_03540 [bacterium]|nr:hypothetical protein [bacterium]